ncbi:hypothetical protein [Streptomyces sp. NPDC001404]|uniref:hypothetical protein n=1 Tax=Streptomyces sp. NPDC001404 TaxID=3364571 RepID=UPI0036B598D6
MTYPNDTADPSFQLPAALWLVSRELRPSDARESWSRGTAATLKVGLHFDVVQLFSGIVERGIRGIKDRDGIENHFRAVGITSAVIVSRSQTAYSLLVPPGTSQNWKEPGAKCIGIDHLINYLGVPVPTRREPPGAHWLLPAPEDDHMLCDPTKVRMLIGKTRERQGRTG